MKKAVILIFAFLIIIFAHHTKGYSISGPQILREVDKVVNSRYSYAFVTMRVYSGSGSFRSVKMKTYTKGKTLSYSYYEYPANIRGMKYLSRNDNIWMYYPLTSRVRKLASHMKKRPISGVGGDFSANDLKATDWIKKYKGRLLKTENNFYVVECKGIGRDTYSRLVLYVNKTTFYPEKIDYYHESGRKMKTLYLKDIRKINGKLFATYLEMISYDRDAKTTIRFSNVSINVAFSNRYFSLSNLRR